MTNFKNRNFWLVLSSLIFLCSLALAPIHTKILGAAWISFVLLSLIVIFQPQNSFALIKVSDALKYSIVVWLFITIVAYVLKLSAQVYHDEFNDVSNFNLRTFVIALISYLLIPRIDDLIRKKALLSYIALSLILVGFAAFFIAVPLRNSFDFGTNQIPWAAGITILACVLQVVMLQRLNEPVFQIFGWINFLLLVVAIFSFGVRASYFFLFWLPCFALSHLFFLTNKARIVRTSCLGLIFFVIGLASLYFIFPEIYKTGIARIDKAYLEIIGFIYSPDQGSNTSVGARLYMWMNALKHISDNAFLGIGLDGTKTLIADLAENSKSPMLIGLNQLHNEYLQAQISYGIIGLISFLLYPLGILIIAIILREQHPYGTVGLFGILFLFLTASITNTNTYHNYFGTMLSLSIGLIFIICRLKEIKKN